MAPSSSNKVVEIYEGEGGASFGGDQEDETVVNFDRKEWLKSVLFDMNINPMIELGESAHPNTVLYDSYPEILDEKKENMMFRVSSYDNTPLPLVNPDCGVLLSGEYGKEDLITSFNPTFFDICKLTLLLRVFVDQESENIVTFGQSYRWLGLFKNRVTFNNQDQTQSINAIKDNEWNDILLTFSYDKESNSGKCLLLINGKEIEAPIDAPLEILSESARTISSDGCFSFVNYSNARCLKGIVGSAVLLNRSCNTFSQLRDVSELLLANHTKSTDTYSKAKEAKINVAQVEHIESVDQFNKLLKKNRLLVLDFFATWCCPCMGIAPKFSALANKYQDATFVKIDVDTQSDIMNRYNVQSMPTFCFIKDGAEIDRLEGANPKLLQEKIIALVELLQ